MLKKKEKIMNNVSSMKPIDKDAIAIKFMNLKPTVKAITEDKVSLSDYKNILPGKDEKVFLSTLGDSVHSSDKSDGSALKQAHSDNNATSLKNNIEEISTKLSPNNEPIAENLHLAIPGLVSGGAIAPALITFRDHLRDNDPEKIRKLTMSSGFFYDDEADYVKKLALENLTERSGDGEHNFLLMEEGKDLRGYACYGLATNTTDRYFLHFLAVENKQRGKGYGKKLLSKTEEVIKEMGGKRLYIETCSNDKFYPTRQFYIKCNYNEEITLEDYYIEGESKVVYLKKFDQ
jgi:ribosomal protein S18 acetylase RimI-like enzyme